MFAITIFQFANAKSDKAANRVAGINHSKTQTIKVYSECGMCKHHIEKEALTVDDIRSAIFNGDTKALSVTDDIFKKNVIDSLQKEIASACHDIEKYTATGAAYNSLPDCCHYQRKPLKQ